MTPKVRVGKLLPHLKRRADRLALLSASDEALSALMVKGDMVAGLVLALKPPQRVLMRARLKA